ncbi:MAG: 3'-5' exonuclease [Lachnospiraceae bacterium]|nr:3'-5' exonuclease [Lachnospiraceae bacterium]MDY3818446.1 3'-5' exonuclease [Lachnospiraceae bacterium]
MNYVALDLEMTGLHLKTDHIIEIGAVRMESGNAAAHFSTLVNPHQTLSAHIIDLTGITDDALRSAPELSEVLPAFLEFCGDDPILGHNLNFDYSFLAQACLNRRLTWHPLGIDTLKLARHFLPAEQKKSLPELRHFFSIETDQVHRAYDDAYAAAMVFEQLYRQYGSSHPAFFEPRPFQIRIKRQQPVTIPQKEQLHRLLSEYTPSPKKDIPLDQKLSDPQFSIDALTRCEASRLIEQLLQARSDGTTPL